jgi:hypothetical protein
MILDTIALVLLSIIALSFLVLALHQRKGRLELLEKYVGVEIEKSIILDKLDLMIKELEAKSVEESDGFLKFVSDSREWAFGYIEEVQTALKEFDDAVSDIFEYSKTYGSIDTESPSKDMLKKVSEAYDKLKTVLPDDMVH